MSDLIVVLGHFDNTVYLTSTGRERLAAGAALYQSQPGSYLAVTGCAPGHPRTVEVLAWLSELALTPDELVDSHNTAEDAFLTEALVQRYCPARLVVVTSDYHVERARLIFNQVFADIEIEVVGVPHRASDEERHDLLAHEQRALGALRTHGLYRPR
ncbi:MAG TPA: YdcF family protein [Anaerolineae bacterium]|jgi:uncharacterized SAM-binding protein YcdF (DUF218 family)